MLLNPLADGAESEWAGRRGGRQVSLILVISSLCVALLAKVAGDFSLSSCLKALIEHHTEANAGFTKASAGSLLSAGTVAYVTGKLLTARVLELLGPGTALSVLLSAACMSHLVIAMAQGATAISLIFGGWVVYNVEVAQLWGVVMVVVAMWVDEEQLARTLAAISLVAELGTLGVVGAYGLALDSDETYAWRRPFFIAAGVALLAAALQGGTMRSSAASVGFRPPHGAVGHPLHPLARASGARALRAAACSSQAWLVVATMLAISAKELSLLGVAPAYAAARLDMDAERAQQLLSLNSLGTVLALATGVALYPRLARHRAAALLCGCSALSLCVDLSWLLLHATGAMSPRALQLGMLCAGFGHALPFHLPAQIFVLRLGGVRHCALLSSLVDLATTLCAASLQSLVEDVVRDDAYGGWLGAQALLALLCLALLAAFLRRDHLDRAHHRGVHRPPPAPPAKHAHAHARAHAHHGAVPTPPSHHATCSSAAAGVRAGSLAAGRVDDAERGEL